MAAETSVEPKGDAPVKEGLSGPLGADFIIPALALCLIAYYSATTLNLTWEAKVTGVFIGAVLAPLCVVHIIRMGLAIARRHATFGFGDLFSNTAFNRQRLGLVLLVALYIVTIEWVGTATGLFLLLVGCMLVMGVRSPRTLLGVAGATATVVYVVLIYLLNSRLPQGPVETLLGSLLVR